MDERLRRFVEYQKQNTRITPRQAAIELLKAGYYQHVQRLHDRYLQGEITLRRLAKELGLEYRQLYALLKS